MNKTALILHAWLNGPDAHWYPWLKTELESRGYTVYLPEIPTMNTDAPNLHKQMEFIEKNIPLDENMIMFGHSLGCLLAMRLAEKHQFSKRNTNTLQLVLEEILQVQQDFSDVGVELSFAEKKGEVTLLIESVGAAHNPFKETLTEEDIGLKLLLAKCENVGYRYEGEKNIFLLNLRIG